MPAGHIDFWFTMGSTYSYLSVMRLVQLERLTGITRLRRRCRRQLTGNDGNLEAYKITTLTNVRFRG
jgi:2-hydroxychromene-2-carboxylate isomerase